MTPGGTDLETLQDLSTAVSARHPDYAPCWHAGYPAGPTQYSSDRIARLTGQGAVGINQQVQRAKLDFRARDFKRFTSSQASMGDDVNKALEIIPQDRVFNMEYTDLGSETVLEKLLEFLGVEPYPMTSVAQAQSFADYRTLQ